VCDRGGRGHNFSLCIVSMIPKARSDVRIGGREEEEERDGQRERGQGGGEERGERKRKKEGEGTQTGKDIYSQH
jgi:hypothetical protein